MRFVGVDGARSLLGRLVGEVAAGGDVVSLTKRGKALAVLVSREEYLELKLDAIVTGDAGLVALGESDAPARRFATCLTSVGAAGTALREWPLQAAFVRCRPARRGAYRAIYRLIEPG
ncbi:MAG: type II toxin-antitoxin system Phd/YefM family antitoxin [Acidimicrobiales bacterium]